jgi:hypothetical protein
MPEEIKVRRANVILRVPKEQAKEYLAKGFDVLAEDGSIAQATIPNDVNVLKQAYVEHLAKIKELENQLAEANKSKTVAKKAGTDATPKKRTTKAKNE